MPALAPKLKSVYSQNAFPRGHYVNYSTIANGISRVMVHMQEWPDLVTRWRHKRATCRNQKQVGNTSGPHTLTEHHSQTPFAKVSFLQGPHALTHDRITLQAWVHTCKQASYWSRSFGLRNRRLDPVSHVLKTEWLHPWAERAGSGDRMLFPLTLRYSKLSCGFVF